MVVNEFEAAIVRGAFAQFLGGKSINAIANTLKEQHPNMFWSAAKLRSILLNSIYVGKVKFGGVEYDGIHQPLISESDFQAVRQLLYSPEREAKKTAPQKTPFRAGYLLSGLIFCSRCGARYSANHGYYKCYSRSKSSKPFIKDPNCKNENWTINALDDYVLRQVDTLLDDAQALQNLIAAHTQEEPQIDRAKIRTRLHEIDNEINHVIDLYQIGSLPMKEIAKRADALESERNSLQEMLKQRPSSNLEQFLSSLEAFRIGINADDISTRRMCVSGVIRAVRIDGRSASIEWRI